MQQNPVECMSRQERAFACACECLAIEQLWRKIILQPEKLCFRRGGVSPAMSGVARLPVRRPLARLNQKARAMCHACMQGGTCRQDSSKKRA